MNFEQAKNCLLKGGKVRRHDWAVNEYIYLSECLILFDESDCKLPHTHDVFYDYEDDKWEVFYEPIKPFKVQTLEWFKPKDKMPEKMKTLITKVMVNDIFSYSIITDYLDETLVLCVDSWAYWEHKE